MLVLFVNMTLQLVWNEQLIRCCQLRFIRKIQLNSNIVLKDSAIAAILRKEDEPLAE